MRGIFFMICILLTFSLHTNETLFSGQYYEKMTLQELYKEEKNIKKIKDDYERNGKLGVLYHFIALKENKGINRAIEYLTKALSIKDNIYLKLYYASSLAILGREEQKNLDLKIKKTLEGYEKIEKLYNENKDNFEILKVYLSVSIELPEDVFHKTDSALKVIKDKENQFDKLSKENQAVILYYKGLLLFNTGKEKDAISIWEKIVEEYKETEVYKDARKMVTRYGG